MKKLISTLMALAILLSINGQESDLLTNKKGTPVLPVKGDVALGMDASSFLTIFKDGFDAPSFDFVQGNTLSLKYFISDVSAIRGIFRIGSSSEINGNEDLSSFTLERTTDITIGGGYEKRVGPGRLQGFYGGEAGFLYERYMRTNQDDDVTQDQVGLGFFLRGFIGAEYFIAPKLALGGQFNWGASSLSTVNNQTNRVNSVTTLDLDNLGGAILLTFYL